MLFQSIIKSFNPNVNTINIPGYVTYNKNRKTESMNGTNNYEKSFALKPHEEDDKDEFIVTGHNQFLKPMNIVNIYGKIESRSKKKEVEGRWGRILEIAAKLNQ